MCGNPDFLGSWVGGVCWRMLHGWALGGKVSILCDGPPGMENQFDQEYGEKE